MYEAKCNYVETRELSQPWSRDPRDTHTAYEANVP